MPCLQYLSDRSRRPGLFGLWSFYRLHFDAKVTCKLPIQVRLIEGHPTLQIDSWFLVAICSVFDAICCVFNACELSLGHAVLSFPPFLVKSRFGGIDFKNHYGTKTRCKLHQSCTTTTGQMPVFFCHFLDVFRCDASDDSLSFIFGFCMNLVAPRFGSKQTPIKNATINECADA